MKSRYIPASILAVAALAACQQAASVATSPAAELGEWMTGAFSSTAQAETDPENYFDIRLYMVPIWTSRDDGPWLYVEQAAASALDRPYRQRVYRLVNTRQGVRSDVYTLPGDPLVLAGSYTDPDRFDNFGPHSLAMREGCSIFLQRNGDAFVGATMGKDCVSSLGDAAYATSEVMIGRDLLSSWDRGFTSDGEQAWGAEKGPYRFVREPVELASQ